MADTSIGRLAEKYATNLDEFIKGQGLAGADFARPTHLSVLTSSEGYDPTINGFRSPEEDAYERQIEGHKIAALPLRHSVQIGTFGNVNWLEVIAPIEDVPQVAFPRVKSAAFLLSNMCQAIKDLDEREENDTGIDYWLEGEGDFYQAVVIKINKEGDQFKWVNLDLEPTLKKRKTNGTAAIYCPPTKPDITKTRCE